MHLSRRAFGFGLLGTAALAALGVPVAWSAIDEERVLNAAIEGFFPPSGSLPSPVEVDAIGNLRAYLAQLPADVRWQARGLLRLVEAAPVATHGARLSSLDPAARQAFLEGMAGSSLYPNRLMAHALKQLCAMSYWQHPATWAHLGYDGPLVGR